MKKGIVIKSTGSWYKVKTNEQEVFECRIKGKFRIKGIKSTNPIAVGDEVEFFLEEEGTGVIQKIGERKNYLIRKSTNLSKQVHIIATNVDQVVLITSVIKPNIALGFIDRILATSEAYSIPAMIVFNKVDVYDDPAFEKLEEAVAIYSDAGYKCLVTSAKNKFGLPDFENELKGKVSLLSGHSGVGKSSLINAIQPDLNLQTLTVSEYNEKGRHTTTFAEMHALDLGGDIIDTPGVRSFGIIDFEKEHLSHYFPEMRAVMDECRFNNCVHIKEPGCAVKEAVENGEIAPSRYENYLAMYEDDGLKKAWE